MLRVSEYKNEVNDRIRVGCGPYNSVYDRYSDPQQQYYFCKFILI